MLPVEIERPQEGYYRTRLVRGGPWMPGRIWRSVAQDPETGETLDRSPMLCAELMGKFVDPYEVWPRFAGNTITKQEFEYLMAVKMWADKHDPSAPEANPTKPVDLNKMKPLF